LETETIKEKIEHINEETAKMSRNTVRLGYEALKTMNNTLAGLRGQGERLRNAEGKLNSAQRGVEDGQRKVTELSRAQNIMPNIFASGRHDREIVVGSFDVPVQVPSSDIHRLTTYEVEPSEKGKHNNEETEENLDVLEEVVSKLNHGMHTAGRVIVKHIVRTNRIIETADVVDDKVAMNRAKLDRIH
jgi:hypothetical protein